MLLMKWDPYILPHLRSLASVIAHGLLYRAYGTNNMSPIPIWGSHCHDIVVIR